MITLELFVSSVSVRQDVEVSQFESDNEAVEKALINTNKPFEDVCNNALRMIFIWTKKIVKFIIRI